MASSMQQSMAGVLVGFVAREYKGFVTGDGTNVAGGVTHLVYVSTDADCEPEAIKCKPDAFAALRGLGFGERVRMDVTFRPARDGRTFQITLDGFEREVPARAPGAAAVNGREAVGARP